MTDINSTINRRFPARSAPSDLEVLNSQLLSSDKRYCFLEKTLLIISRRGDCLTEYDRAAFSKVDAEYKSLKVSRSDVVDSMEGLLHGLGIYPASMDIKAMKNGCLTLEDLLANMQ